MLVQMKADGFIPKAYPQKLYGGKLVENRIQSLRVSVPPWHRFLTKKHFVHDEYTVTGHWDDAQRYLLEHGGGMTTDELREITLEETF